MSVVVENVTKKFGDQLAVNNISFSVDKGQILGFLGPNGAGKSTTMKMITGYTKSNKGNIKVCGIDVELDSLDARRKVGYLPESNPLYGDMYVREYLAFVADVYKIENRKSRIDEVIELTGLEVEKHKFIHQLSKGYRQRVGLAQAILHDPEVLILDEPTSGLDPNQLSEIRNLIKNLGKEKTVIFSSHIMQEVQAICDKVVIIDRGKIVLNDNIDMLDSAINEERVIMIEFERNVSEGEISKIEDIKKIQIDGNRVEVRTDKSIDVRPALFDLAVDSQNRILEMTQKVSSVEDIFKQITAQ